jgi:hypothetical protein
VASLTKMTELKRKRRDEKLKKNRQRELKREQARKKASK